MNFRHLLSCDTIASSQCLLTPTILSSKIFPNCFTTSSIFSVVVESDDVTVHKEVSCHAKYIRVLAFLPISSISLNVKSRIPMDSYSAEIEKELLAVDVFLLFFYDVCIFLNSLVIFRCYSFCFCLSIISDHFTSAQMSKWVSFFDFCSV